MCIKNNTVKNKSSKPQVNLSALKMASDENQRRIGIFFFFRVEQLTFSHSDLKRGATILKMVGSSSNILRKKKKKNL